MFEVEVNAVSPEQAARLARIKIQTQPVVASVCDPVRPMTGRSTEVELGIEDL